MSAYKSLESILRWREFKNDQLIGIRLVPANISGQHCF